MHLYFIHYVNLIFGGNINNVTEPNIIIIQRCQIKLYCLVIFCNIGTFECLKFTLGLCISKSIVSDQCDFFSMQKKLRIIFNHYKKKWETSSYSSLALVPVCGVDVACAFFQPGLSHIFSTPISEYLSFTVYLSFFKTPPPHIIVCQYLQALIYSKLLLNTGCGRVYTNPRQNTNIW